MYLLTLRQAMDFGMKFSDQMKRQRHDVKSSLWLLLMIPKLLCPFKRFKAPSGQAPIRPIRTEPRGEHWLDLILLFTFVGGEVE